MPVDPTRQYKDYRFVKRIWPNEVVEKFSSPLYLVTKNPKKGADPHAQKHRALWYFKRNPPVDDGLGEEIAQEFLRMLSPDQPKTRRIIHEKNIFIASKAVPHSKTLSRIDPKIFYDGILAGDYRNLGEKEVLIEYLCEIDHKNGNILVDKYGNIIKIDGGFSFAHFYKGHEKRFFEFTAASIDTLPFILDSYDAYNWLHYIGFDEEKKTKKTDDIGSLYKKKLINCKIYRREVNRGLLKIILLPECAIEPFVASYTKDIKKIAQFSQFFIERKLLFKKAAQGNKKFIEYLKSSDATQDFKQFLTHIFQFKTSGKNVLFTKLPTALMSMQSEFEMLRCYLEPDVINEFEILTHSPTKNMDDLKQDSFQLINDTSNLSSNNNNETVNLLMEEFVAISPSTMLHQFFEKQNTDKTDEQIKNLITIAQQGLLFYTKNNKPSTFMAISTKLMNYHSEYREIRHYQFALNKPEYNHITKLMILYTLLTTHPNNKLLNNSIINQLNQHLKHQITVRELLQRLKHALNLSYLFDLEEDIKSTVAALSKYDADWKIIQMIDDLIPDFNLKP